MTIFYNTLRIAALAVLVSATACSSKKDDTTPAPAAAAPTSISWAINGAKVTGTVSSAVLSRDSVRVLITDGSNRIRMVIPLRTGQLRLSTCSQCAQKAPDAIVTYSTNNGTKIFTQANGSMTVSNSTSRNTTGIFSVLSVSYPSQDVVTLMDGKFSFNY